MSATVELPDLLESLDTHQGDSAPVTTDQPIAEN